MFPLPLPLPFLKVAIMSLFVSIEKQLGLLERIMNKVVECFEYFTPEFDNILFSDFLIVKPQDVFNADRQGVVLREIREWTAMYGTVKVFLVAEYTVVSA
jgi:hypothetical protein